VSTQLLDPGGRLVAQHDSMPVDNTLPISTWDPDEMSFDPVELAIPGSVGPGKYSLIVVVYDHQSLARLVPRGPSSVSDHAVVANVMIMS
jgi:hypothetical protein